MNPLDTTAAPPVSPAAAPSTSPPSPTPSASATPPTTAAKTVVRQQFHDASAAVKAGASGALDTAKETATHLLAEQKGKLADLVSSYSKSLSAAGDRLAEEDGNSLVQPARRAARQLENAAVYLRDKSGTEMLHDLSRVARSKPEWIFGGLFVAGLAAARFLKASAPGVPPTVPRSRITPATAPATPQASSPSTYASADER